MSAEAGAGGAEAGPADDKRALGEDEEEQCTTWACVAEADALATVEGCSCDCCCTAKEEDEGGEEPEALEEGDDGRVARATMTFEEVAAAARCCKAGRMRRACAPAPPPPPIIVAAGVIACEAAEGSIGTAEGRGKGPRDPRGAAKSDEDERKNREK